MDYRHQIRWYCPQIERTFSFLQRGLSPNTSCVHLWRHFHLWFVVWELLPDVSLTGMLLLFFKSVVGSVRLKESVAVGPSESWKWMSLRPCVTLSAFYQRLWAPSWWSLGCVFQVRRKRPTWKSSFLWALPWLPCSSGCFLSLFCGPLSG